MEKQRCDTGEAEPLRSFTHTQLLPSFALLIEADNTSIELFPMIMNQVEIWGSVTLRRAYGNQETLLSQKWKELCLLYALQPMGHIGISGVKNATDIALTVDAMDLLHTQAIRCFCLVTGDQDFTALVLRLRSYGCQVYCIGKPSKADALAEVCTGFVPVETPSSPPAKKSPLALGLPPVQCAPQAYSLQWKRPPYAQESALRQRVGRCGKTGVESRVHLGPYAVSPLPLVLTTIPLERTLRQVSEGEPNNDARDNRNDDCVALFHILRCLSDSRRRVARRFPAFSAAAYARVRERSGAPHRLHETVHTSRRAKTCFDTWGIGTDSALVHRAVHPMDGLRRGGVQSFCSCCRG